MLDGSLKSIPIQNVSQFNSIEAIEGDLIYVREYAYRTATISGAVYKPGKYTMAAGETIEDLIDKAGGFTDNAYPFGAVYENEDARFINKSAQELLYQEFLDNSSVEKGKTTKAKFVQSFEKHFTDTTVNFKIKIDKSYIEKWLGAVDSDGITDLEKVLKLNDTISISNMYLFDAENNIKISQTTAEQAIHLEDLMNMCKVSEDQPKITQPGNQQIEMASEENPSLLGQQKEVNIKDFEEKDNFK